MSGTVLIMAGGTGGHIFPALAVAEALREQGWTCVWLGVVSGMEARLVPQHGFACEWVQMAGLRGKGVKRLLGAPWMLARAVAQCRAVIRRVRPAVVIGFGGYVTAPGGIAARMSGVPVIVHEQNSVAGLANRLLAKFAVRVLTAFPGVFADNAKVRLTGNPIRDEIAHVAEPAGRYALRHGRLHVLVVGGSLGAQALNSVVPAALAQLPEAARPVVIHQSGEKLLDSLRQLYAAAKVEAETVAFIDDMAAVYRDADLVICRAGALTIAELAAVGVAALLVPFPHAVDDHQTGNARFLADHGAAFLIQQQELTAERLAALLKVVNREQLADMAVCARAKARPNATQEVARICMEVAAAQSLRKS